MTERNKTVGDNMSNVLENYKILQVVTMIENIDVKISAITSLNLSFQLLCLVLNSEDIVLRYSSNDGTITIKIIAWFNDNNKIIKDICFNDSGSFLLAICQDNTLHVIPALKIMDASIIHQTLFSVTEITSYNVPFTLPKNSVAMDTQDPHSSNGKSKDGNSPFTSTMGTKYYELSTENATDDIELSIGHSQHSSGMDDMTRLLNDGNLKDIFSIESLPGPSNAKTTSTSGLKSILQDHTTHPTCVIWWETSGMENRAIVGYSDGSICVVGLMEHCPLIGYTYIDQGSITNLFICNDYIAATTILLINTARVHEQWKLLLEQKNYVFPGVFMVNNLPSNDIKSTISLEVKPENDDWQYIVGSNSTGGIPSLAANTAVETNTSRQERYDKDFDILKRIESEETPTALTLGHSTSTVSLFLNNPPSSEENVMNKLFPVARAKLLALRKLGAQKLEKLRLKLMEGRAKTKDNEKLRDELAALDLPSIMPEALENTNGLYFNLQTCEDRCMLGALQAGTDKFSVHSLDFNMTPLYLFQLPAKCCESVITQNILYAIEDRISEQSELFSTILSQDSQTFLAVETPTITTNPLTDENSANLSNQSSTITVGTEKTTLASSEMYIKDKLYILSSFLSSTTIEDQSEFNPLSILGVYYFQDETILNIHRKKTMPCQEFEETTGDDIVLENSNSSNDNIVSPSLNMKYKSAFDRYLKVQNTLLEPSDTGPMREASTSESVLEQVMNAKFPKIHFDNAIIVTDQNVYSIKFNGKPHEKFIEMVENSDWGACEQFCKTFNVPLTQCIEFAGDIFLKNKKTTKAILTYGKGKISIMKTALKLALYNEVKALMHLCGMVLRSSYIINSKFLMSSKMNFLVDSANLRNVDNRSLVNLWNRDTSDGDLNTGIRCSDFSYSSNDIDSELQLSTSATYHLSNLMFLSMCERCEQDHNYIPLWNFIFTNNKYHCSLSSIILVQSGLYSSAILFAMTRGAFLDVFCCLIGAADSIPESSHAINTFMYNLSEPIFMECITYLNNYSIDYFEVIRKFLCKLESNVLQRLSHQLNIFSPIYRPIMSRLADMNIPEAKIEESSFYIFIKSFIETYLLIQIKNQTESELYQDNYLDGLSFFYTTDKENIPVISVLDNFSPISAGYSHAGCALNSVAYMWGFNGINCSYDRSAVHTDNIEVNKSPSAIEFFRESGINVYALHCGKQHTLVFTNNGLYAFGSNEFGQLGVGKNIVRALQPMLITTLDSQEIKFISVGSYHNAVIANHSLYMWGWNVYGQLGLGTVLDVSRPTLVPFFEDVHVCQIALGHVHSVVLTYDNNLYTFGSNHYGQLGIGEEYITRDGGSIGSQREKFLKTLIPVKIDFTPRISLISSKYFSTLALTETNQLFVWGSSPHALRIAIQAKKKEKMQKKMMESLRNDVNRRTEMAQILGGISPVHTETKVTPSQSNKKNGYEAETKTEVQPPELLKKAPRVVDSPEENGTSDPLLETSEELDPNVEEENEDFDENEGEDNESEENEDEENEDIDTTADSLEDIIDAHKEHLKPALIDTNMVNGKITQLSCGLYHFALLTVKNKLYTWGKNMEKQLGRKGANQTDCPRPTPIDSVDNIIYVSCGSDFTIVMNKNFQVKAFGNTNNGQCGKVVNLDNAALQAKLLRFRMKKRFIRCAELYHYVEIPIDIIFPSIVPHTKITVPNNQSIKQLRPVPKYYKHFLEHHGLTLLAPRRLHYRRNSPRSFSIINENERLSRGISFVPQSDSDSQFHASMQSLPLTNLVVDLEASNGEFPFDKIQLQKERIHYCFQIFHYVYDHKFVEDFAKKDSHHKYYEFQLRVLMLNNAYLEAFKLIMQAEQDEYRKFTTKLDAKTNTDQLSNNLIKIFEFFTYDNPHIVPMENDDIKYFIHEMFNHFIVNNLNKNVLEEFFLQNMTKYILHLGYLLYFHFFHSSQSDVNLNSNSTNTNINLNSNSNSVNTNINARFSDELDIEIRDKIWNQYFRNKLSSLYNADNHDLAEFSDLVHVHQIFNYISPKFHNVIYENFLKYCSENVVE